MKRIHEQKIDDAKYYERIWSEETNSRPYYDAVRMRALIEPVKDGDSVVDIGGGVFGACQYIAEKTQIKAHLWWYDQSYTAQEILLMRNLPMSMIVGEVEPKIRFSDEMFDVVMAGEIIEHVEDPANFAKELVRICKASGTITLSTVNTKSENAIKHGDYPEHLWEFEPQDLIDFFEPYGDTEYKEVGDYHIIYCRRR